jgi:hypothetical protein
MIPEDGPERVQRADEILATPYARHLIQEETHRQIDAWLKWRVLPLVAVVGAALAFFGWNVKELHSTLTRKLADVSTQSQAMSDTTVRVQEMVANAAQRVGSAKELIDRADANARIQSDTVKESFDLISRSRQSVLDTQTRLAQTNAQVTAAAASAERVVAERDSLTRSLQAATARLETLARNQEGLAKDIEARRTQLDSVSLKFAASLADIRRIRTLQVRFVSAGANPQSIDFDDPDGRGPYKLTIYELSMPAAGSFSAIVSVQSTETERCVYRARAAFDNRIPFDLSRLSTAAGSAPCLPAGLRMTLHAIPAVAPSDPSKPSVALLMIDARAP